MQQLSSQSNSLFPYTLKKARGAQAEGDRLLWVWCQRCGSRAHAQSQPFSVGLLVAPVSAGRIFTPRNAPLQVLSAKAEPAAEGVTHHLKLRVGQGNMPDQVGGPLTQLGSV